jgi:hypothetical protein
MKPDDMQRAPKVFCESIKIGYTPEYVVMAVSSGEQATAYALTPEHAKRLLLYLTHEITEYEKNHGPISAQWTPAVVSPLQPRNLPFDQS